MLKKFYSPIFLILFILPVTAQSGYQRNHASTWQVNKKIKGNACLVDSHNHLLWSKGKQDHLKGFLNFGPINRAGGRGSRFRFGKNQLIITDGESKEAASTFNLTRQNVEAFTAEFTYRGTDFKNGGGGGIAMVFQNDPRGIKAAGIPVNNTGFSGIKKSVAFEINIYAGGKPGLKSEGSSNNVATGKLPSGNHPGIALQSSSADARYENTDSINLRSGDPVRVYLNYNGITLQAVLKDQITYKTFAWQKSLDIPLLVGSNKAFVGFTGSCGTSAALQIITGFSFEPKRPSNQVFMQKPAVDFVNPFIGTGAGPGGSINIFLGATMPFGMVQLGPDTEPLGYGYHYYQTKIEGFSMTHMSGVGCANEGDVFFTATTGEVHTGVKNIESDYSHAEESASPGYYYVKLLRWGIAAELTASVHSGMAKFIFPAGKQANIIVPVSHTLNYTKAVAVNIVNDSTLEGYVENHIFCGNKQTYRIYFVMIFNKPFDGYGTWNVMHGRGILKGLGSEHSWKGCYASWTPSAQPQTITASIGVSFVSINGAMNNLRKEVLGKSFDKLKEVSKSAWEKQLNLINVQGGRLSQRIEFYTALYHSMLMPNTFSDVDGRYLGFDGKIHKIKNGHVQYTNFSGWDIYRSQIPLLALISPKRVGDFCRSIVNMYKQGGWIGRWPQINKYTNVMCSSPLSIIISTAWKYGIKDFDINTAWQGMYKDATQAPPDGKIFKGESGINWINKLHFCPDDKVGYGSVSQMQEDCLAYASLYYLAKSLGKTNKAKELYNRALYYRNQFNKDNKFLQPRLSSGKWVKNFKPKQRRGFIEGNGWQYQWLVPYDMKWLINAVGRNLFNHRLEKFFSYPKPSWYSQYYNPYNEVDLEASFEFCFSGKPWLSQKVVRRILKENYTLTSDGIPGNDDCGEMSSWAVLSMMGLYSIDPAGGVYELLSPVFNHITINLKTPYKGRRFIITASPDAAFMPYIKSVKLNGSLLSRCWINVNKVTKGGTLFFNLDKKPNKLWGSASVNEMPSLNSLRLIK